jgi:putative DNA primase/helicase
VIPAEIVISTFQGRRVFPVAAGSKTPLVKWRSSDPASSDLDQVNKWYIRHGACNWGMATGADSGVFVVDTDTKEGYDWVVANGLTDTYSVKTGGNTPEKLSYGYHFYFIHPGGDVRIKNSCKDLSSGVDVRGDGGYVLIPPSVTEQPYYVANQRDLAVAPAWLVERVTKTEVERQADLVGDLSPQDKEHGRNIYHKACRQYPETPDGQWNIELNNLAGTAGRLVAAGCFDEDYALQLAMQFGAAYVQDNRKAFLATWKSGFKWGLQSPWVPLSPEDVGFSGGVPAPPSLVGLKTLNEVTLKPIRWLWPSWLPLGKMVIYAGPGGVGKSSVTFSWAATISRGGQWPDGTPCRPGRVLIWSGEDDCEDTIAPRLKAMGADLSRIQVIQTAHGQPFDPARDFAQLKVHFKPGDVSLLIIDPIVSAVAGDMNKANEVRRGLQAIVDFASDLDCCVVGITHFTKGSGGKNPTERVTGSQAFTAFARMTIVSAKDEDSDDCVIARSKSNISVDRGGLKYRIEPVTIQGNIETTKISWQGAVEGGAREILQDLEPDESKGNAGKVKQAAEWLELAMSQGRELEVSRIPDESQFSIATLKRAKKLLPIVSRKESNNGGWYWSMPGGMMPF